ncbi:acyl transferase domain-containing protein [Nonomuraea fuscirosea]|uniref:Acyl transferase domain-containing protein n=1 Tax=Nonomuraea fuscirosea TaxID=1291556 RepID=A0A2T0ME34_9ACTN|nr:type I polyketide synthase [Nonomuraea fuscirosea]PRX55799.1 acyl transferase domain-containing protein [Nonomuraea fuscirosea]
MNVKHGRDPIAIVGAGCRLPGARTPGELWRIVSEGRDVLGTIPQDRFDVEHGAARRRRDVLSGAGGYLDDVAGFDARFFGVTPFEALRLDPQQRVLLEVIWEALDDAGIPAESLAGSDTGVYASLQPSGYWDLLRRSGMYDMHAALGAAVAGIFPGRVSTLLDLRGPSMGLDAACATSLLAVHVACRALWSGEVELAIVGGSNLQLVPDLYFSLGDAGVISGSGKCRFGDVSGDGYVRSEGVVSLILKPLARALADGDRPYAVILGGAATHDGRTGPSLVAPGLEGHKQMLRAAYRDAGVAPADVDYVEAHGPGTHTGDSTELAALDAIMGEGREDGRRCLVGSVKSNIGHTEFAAGLAGLLKTALAVRHRIVPATLHVEEPHAVLLDPGTAVELALCTQDWPDRAAPAVAGVSSFGMSGTNIHLVLSEAPQAAPPVPARPRPSRVLPLSARDPHALRALATAYADLLDPVAPADPAVPAGLLGSTPEVGDVCFSAGARRSHHDHRLAVTGEDARSLAAALRGFVRDGGDVRRVTGAPKVVFVFPGQGGQWAGMGRRLLATEPGFAAHLRACSQAVHAELGWSPADALLDGEPLTRVDRIQPALWAVQVALAAVWREWGVEPDLLIGHSMGEIAAAVTAGALSVADGAAVVARRSRVLSRLDVPGAMWVVALGEEQVRAAIGEEAGRACVGVVNSRHSTVLSGDPAALERIVEPLRARGVFCRRVEVDYASHAPQVEPVRERLLGELAGLRPGPCAIPVHSSAWDRVVGGEELDASYWFENLRLPVRFADAARAALADGRPTLFVELSPHPVLGSALEEEIEATGARADVVTSLHRDEPDCAALTAALARAYELGCRPRWDRVQPGAGVPLPGYPWQRRRFWPDGPKTTARTTTTAGIGNGTGTSALADAGAVSGGPAGVGAEDSAVIAGASPAAAAGAGAKPDLAALSESEVAGRVADLAAQVLSLPGHEIGVDVPLTLLGLDSVLATRFKERMRRDLGVDVPLRDLLGPDTLLELATRLRASANA